MSFSWSTLHAQLHRHSMRLTFEENYRAVRARHPEALRRGDSASLLAYLADRAVHGETKNRALRALVSSAQTEESTAETCTTLLLLALWPGLDAVRSRLRRDFPANRRDLDAELVGRMTLAIHCSDLGRVHRIAATLLRNVERDLRRDMIRGSRERPLDRPLDELLDHVARVDEGSFPDAVHSIDADALTGRLRDLLGRDAHLFLLVVVGGCSQREAAQVLGITHDAARKRFQRAIAQLQKNLTICPNPDG